MHRVTAAIGILVLAGVPGVALAQDACPSGIARDGIWLEFPDRTVQSRVLSDGRIAETEYMFDDGAVFGYITLPLGLVTDSWALVNGRVPPADRERVSYQGTPAEVPLPAPGVRFDGLELARFADGGETRYAITVAVGEAMPFSIGACRYTGLPVDVTRVEPGGPVLRDRMVHLVELGVTIYLGFSDDNAQPEALLPVAISAEPPLSGGAATPGTAPPPLPQPPGGVAPPPQK